MIHESVSLDALGVFREVARQKSFAAAARQWHVTPSAVSHRIADLEASLDQLLFERTTRRVRLTEAGRALYASVDPALELIHEGITRLAERGTRRSLTLSCSPSFAIRWLLPNLPMFRARDPGIEVHVAAGDEIADPRRDDIDLCIRYGAGQYPGLKVTALTTEYVFPVCSAEFRRRHRLKRASQLLGLPLIHHDVLEHHPAHVNWTRWLKSAKLERHGTLQGTHYSHAHMALTAALASEGVALGRTSLVREDLARGHLVAPFGPRVRSGLRYWLVRREQEKAEVAAFVDWVSTAIRARARGARTGRSRSQ